jgi:FkbM family methyltransferase
MGFIPFIRHFNYPEASFKMWIANPDAAKWYDEEGWRKCGEFRALKGLAKKGDRVLEVGSHHGFTAMLLAKFVGPEGSVLSIEAHPQNAMVAQAQLGLNHSYANLQFIHAAGASASGTVKIAPSHNSYVTDDEGADSITVAAVTGDTLDNEHGPFDLIKIDVEGFELDVLQGCKSALLRGPKIALEIHMEGLRSRSQSVADIFRVIDLDRYEGQMVVRADDFNLIKTFSPSAMPESGIVNAFLWPKK